MPDDPLAPRLAALGNETRLRIIRTLVRAGRPGLTVGALQDRMDVAASTLSHHLAQLVRAGLVRQERQGTSLVCHVDLAAVNGLVAALLAECCIDEAPE